MRFEHNTNTTPTSHLDWKIPILYSLFPFHFISHISALLFRLGFFQLSKREEGKGGGTERQRKGKALKASKPQSQEGKQEGMTTPLPLRLLLPLTPTITPPCSILELPSSSSKSLKSFHSPFTLNSNLSSLPSHPQTCSSHSRRRKVYLSVSLRINILISETRIRSFVLFLSPENCYPYVLEEPVILHIVINNWVLIV